MDERELTDREALFALLAAAPDGILLVSADRGEILFANDAVEGLFGYAPDELRGRSVEHLVPDRLRGRHTAQRDAYAGHPRARPMGAGLDLVAVRKDGGEFQAEISLSPMRWQERDLVVAIVRDVSEQRAAAAARVELARVQAVEELVGGLDAVVWESADAEHTRFVYVGGRDEMLLGYSRERWLSPGFWQSIVHADDGALVLAVSSAAVEQQTFEVDYRVVDAGGRTVTVHDTVSVGENGRLRGVLVDVTERRELEARLAQALKMEAVGQLAGGVAHDFNNLITIAAGHAGRLARRLGEPADRESAEQIVAAAERAAALTQKLLTLARRTETRRERIDLGAVVRGVMPMLESALPAEIAVTVEVADDVPRIEADRTELEQVVMNLVLNARDAMPAGGTLSVRADAVVPGDEGAAGRSARPGPYAVLTVSDSGHGIVPELRERIFEPFFTTKGADHGTGLGLATVSSIVKDAGGYVEVDSEPGMGTTIRVALPAADELSIAEAAADAGAGGVVLVVDDEPALRELARVVLADAGFVVLEAGDARAAISVAERLGPRVELLLTDVVMPRLSGPELALRLRRLCPALRVLYMSGYRDRDLARRGLGSEAELIEKPFDPEELAARVGRILGRAG